ncbi:hypothetical protein [Streptomyces coriariae]|uniref:hypothetical protein n=1 Tax=Streptomyces coriariae TaxID=2864460 RepID=UPI001E636532|nr:hypothetical protein [Streptomyces coriariae]
MDGSFPDDLVQAQQAWDAIYRALAAPRPCNVTVLRRRLLRLSVHLWWHPYWTQGPAPAAGREELRRRAVRWGGSSEPAAGASDGAGGGDPACDPTLHPGPR